MATDISIIICTFNRAQSLRQTLNALGKVKVPDGCRSELIVVDNASTDATASVAQNARFQDMQTIYLHEPRKGKSNALNSGISLARGETLIFTDDDILPSEDWLQQILLCFNQTQCDALVGKIVLAPRLERPWIRKLEKLYLAIPEPDSGGPFLWVGANAAIQRRCLQRVPGFDPELGPGTLGNEEDALFGYQLAEAGFRCEYASRAAVVHQPDRSRLRRGAWLQAERQRARSKAYLLHHWEHVEINAPALKWLWFATKLGLRRLLQPPRPLNSEGFSRWERSYVYHLALCQQYCIERRRPRNYARHGLKKIGPVQGTAPIPICPTDQTVQAEHSNA